MSTRKSELTPEQLAHLETHLAGTLRPVAPRKDFVHRLRDRVHLPERKLIVSRLQDWNRLFFVFASVMSGILLLITVARALYYYFLQRRGMA